MFCSVLASKSSFNWRLEPFSFLKAYWFTRPDFTDGPVVPSSMLR